MNNPSSLHGSSVQSTWPQEWITRIKRVMTLIVFCAVASVAYAEDKPPSTYAPEHCEFSVTFPGEPYTARRCEDADKTQCYDLISYTQVYALSSTVNFRVICNPINAEVFEAYSADVMKATLRAMTDTQVIKEFESSFREEEAYKQAGLVGEGFVGRTPTIYLAQLWIGKGSALSVEAELIGEADEAADTLFRDVLRSVGVKVVEGEENR